jgi:hypothetical protein
MFVARVFSCSSDFDLEKALDHEPSVLTPPQHSRRVSRPRPLVFAAVPLRSPKAAIIMTAPKAMA